MPHRRPAKILWTLLQTLLWGALLSFLALLAIPRVSHFEILVVRSGSMEPAIRTGGIVLIDTSARDLRIGDIASFRDAQGGNVITHRVVALRDGGFVTRGDANQSADAPLRRPAEVVGRERMSLPYLGFVLYVIERPLVFVLLLGATGGYFVLSELGVIWRELRKLGGRREESTP